MVCVNVPPFLHRWRRQWEEVRDSVGSRDYLVFLVLNTFCTFWIVGFFGILPIRFDPAVVANATWVIAAVSVSVSPWLLWRLRPLMLQSNTIADAIRVQCVCGIGWCLLFTISSRLIATTTEQHSLIPVPVTTWLQYATMVAFALLRDVHFSLAPAFIAQKFGHHRVGRLFAISLSIPSLIARLQGVLIAATMTLPWIYDILQGVSLSAVLVGFWFYLRYYTDCNADTDAATPAHSRTSV